MQTNMPQRATRGAAWATLGEGVGRGFQFITDIVLSRILVPADFGLMAFVVSIMALSDSLAQMGFSSALIQKQEDPKQSLNTAWTLNIITGLFFMALMILFAPMLAHVLGSDRAVNIFRVLSINFLIRGASNVAVIYLRRNLTFRKQFFFDSTPIIAYTLLVVPLALMLHSVWALIFGLMFRRVIEFIMSYVLVPYKPRLEIDGPAVKALFSFGSWIVIGGLVSTAMRQGISTFIGIMFTVPELGYYNRAEVFSIMIFQMFNNIIVKVGFPVYSLLMQDVKKLRSYFFKTQALILFIAVPLSLAIVLFAREFVLIFLTRKFYPSIVLMELLGVYGLLRIILFPVLILFNSIGKPRWNATSNFIQFAVLAVAAYPFSKLFGLVGLPYALIASIVVAHFYSWPLALKRMRASSVELARSLVYPLVNGAITSLIVVLVRAHLPWRDNLLELGLMALLAGVVYLAIAFLFDRFLGYGIFSLIRSRVRDLGLDRFLPFLSRL